MQGGGKIIITNATTNQGHSVPLTHVKLAFVQFGALTCTSAQHTMGRRAKKATKGKSNIAQKLISGYVMRDRTLGG